MPVEANQQQHPGVRAERPAFGRLFAAISAVLLLFFSPSANLSLNRASDPALARSGNQLPCDNVAVIMACTGFLLERPYQNTLLAGRW